MLKNQKRVIGIAQPKAGKQKKKQSISSLKKKLWGHFSLYIRQRDQYTCFTCGRKGEGSGIHAGHYIPKSIGGIGLYFDETNVHAQCYNCNINLGGYGAIYHQKMIDKYGEDFVKELWRRKEQDYNKWSENDYIIRIERYKSLSTI